jgi:protein involved in polysaccharide export with SLBB domain
MFFRTKFLRAMVKLALGARLLVAGSLCCIAIALATDQLDAQQMPNLSADQLQQLQQMQNQQGSYGANQAIAPQQTILEPNVYPGQELQISRLEQIMSTRAGVRLKQFGYDQMGVGRAVSLPQMGAVQDDYVLGAGDEIVVSLRGQENAEYRVTVDRDGRVTLPRMTPISAGGRTFGDFRADLVNAVHRAYVATEGSISVGRLRQVSVLVSGEINSPGVRTLTGLSTPADAILVSGGVKKTGSLRNLYILRGGRRITIDLYSVLTGNGEVSHVALADGDRLVVPPLGPTAAVAGWVRRPGIFEIANGRSSISVRDLLSIAGGLEVRGKYRLSVLRMTPDGRSQMTQLERQAGTVGDSEILFAQPSADQTTSMATLSGGTALAGQYSVKNTKLSEILKAPGALGDNPYTLFGIISRRDPTTLLRTLVAFTPVAVLNNSEDLNVQSDDIVRVVSAKEARVLLATLQRYETLRQSSDEALRNPLSQPQQTYGQGFATQNPAFPSTQYGSTQTPGANALTGLSGKETGSSLAVQSLAQTAGGDEAARQALQQAEADQLRSGAGQNPYSQQPNYQTPSPTANQLQPQSPYQPQPPYSAQYPGESQTPYQSQLPSQTQLPYQSPSPYQTQNPYIQPPQYQMQQPPFAPNLEEEPAVPEQMPSNREVTRLSQLATQLHVDPLVLANFLQDHSVNVDGAVRGAGLYFVGPEASLQSLLMAAGGVETWADKSSVEVISTNVDANAGAAQTLRKTVSLGTAAGADYIVSPHDEVRVNKVFTDVEVGSVTVQGQVRHVGTYQIVRGEHLSDLLLRAGGLTDSAYPYGTVFLRRSAAEREQDAFRREAGEIEDQLLLAMSRRDPNSKLSPDAFTAMQSYVSELRNQRALGRVTIVADPTVLAAHPDMDPLLEPGDVVYIPQRPYAVSVLGQVLQPGSVPFRQGMDASDYLDQAGGVSQFADKSEIFLVLPDGSARRVETSWLDFGGDEIPPGSTIFVARDISGIDIHQIIIDTTQIFSQLATSAAALAVLSKQ